MKEVLCIKKPGFYLKGGERYGPLYNEVCLVTRVQKGFWGEGKLWYPEELYYTLEGYNQTYEGCPVGFPLFRAIYFVDLISDEELAMELIGTSSYITPRHYTSSWSSQLPIIN